MNKFHTAKGRLTAYAFACGYIECRPMQGTTNDRNVEIFQYGGTRHYNVRAHDHTDGRRLFWETFNTLAEARKHYDHAEALVVTSI